jgi:hypothetical protein
MEWGDELMWEFDFLGTSGACGSEWSEASGLPNVLIVALPKKE